MSTSHESKAGRFLDLSGRGALVVGGSRGIGYAVAERFCRAGANVCIVGRTEDSVRHATSLLSAEGYTVGGFFAEVTDVAAVALAHQRVEATLGQVDILVIAAGLVGPTAPVWEYELNTFERLMEVNFMGTVHWLRAVLPGMRRRRRGAVVTFASVAGKEGNPGQAAYCAAKAAVMALTKSVAKEVVSEGIRVNCVAPGITATEMALSVPEETRKYILSKVPMGRMGEPAEIAAVAHLLASDEAGFTTGQVYDASGGRATY
ncbi:MAG TPA: SDR family NAD(P)-dependent oxidoreductase [Chthoniobacterales bacterium]